MPPAWLCCRDSCGRWARPVAAAAPRAPRGGPGGLTGRRRLAARAPGHAWMATGRNEDDCELGCADGEILVGETQRGVAGSSAATTASSRAACGQEAQASTVPAAPSPSYPAAPPPSRRTASHPTTTVRPTPRGAFTTSAASSPVPDQRRGDPRPAAIASHARHQPAPPYACIFNFLVFASM